MSGARVLFIDAYDSFANNIIDLLRSELQVLVETIKIDDERFVLNDEAFRDHLNGFDAIVAGPGPGHPENSNDVGLIGRLWDQPSQSAVPVLGICLGFQSLCLSFGGKVERLRDPRHGMVTPVLHCSRDIFERTDEIVASQYHSLHVKLGHKSDEARQQLLWQPAKPAHELIPLAYDLSDERNGPILMAVRHCHKPFWGVQYHPESICTNESGRRLIRNWWRLVCTSNATVGRKNAQNIRPSVNLNGHSNGFSLNDKLDSINTVQWKSFQSTGVVDVANITNLFRADFEPILLESGCRQGKPVNEETGRFSLIGFPDARSIHIRYSITKSELNVSTAESQLCRRKANSKDAFTFLERYLEEHKFFGGPEHIPFWGGLVGFISYEAGLENINVPPAQQSNTHPDIWFVLVERSIVVDHVSGEIYMQSLRSDDAQWLSTTASCLKQSATSAESEGRKLHNSGKIVSSPDHGTYRQKVRECQEHLRAGSSYELCLTDTTLINSQSDPWSLYQRLRQENPAPFGAYFSPTAPPFDRDLPQDEIRYLSSSPERFLSWSRDGKCQFRPIKGTVKKSPGTTREQAESILNSPKERAENLMIVDLIRHDLSGVKKYNSPNNQIDGPKLTCNSAHNVHVPKLMTVEEYHSVYQLVSVIEGDISGSGVPVLAASLPPGSMTGAPKKRSCELLQQIEGGKPRGLYSGVFGYLDVGGGGDFSVVIRSAFKWGDGNWRVGAGGAVTALSEDEAEWQEMLAKRENVLRAFV